MKILISSFYGKRCYGAIHKILISYGKRCYGARHKDYARIILMDL